MLRTKGVSCVFSRSRRTHCFIHLDISDHGSEDGVMDKAMLDFYSNVILSSFSRLTATSASALTDGTIRHEENHAVLEF